MDARSLRTVAVCGATGRQGGAVTRGLLGDGWKVRALTRHPDRAPARALAALGAEVIATDMEDPESLRAAFAGVDGVYSVQNGMASGFDREVMQGNNVAEAAMEAGVRHLVYGSAGTGAAGTGVPSWEAKLRVEEHIRRLGVPATVLRPMAFMELMTDKAFFPPVAVWRIWPKLSGEDRPIVWLAVEDLGAIAAIVFDRAEEFVGRELILSSDVQSIAECRQIYRDVTGKPPPSFPMPMWLFDRFTRHDLTKMWRWLRNGDVSMDTGGTRAILPSAMTVREWLTRRTSRTGEASGDGNR